MPRDEEKAPAIPQQQQQQNKAPLSKILLVCMISYVGYLLLGAWCYYVEQRHEEEFHNQKSQDADWAEKGLVLELRVATIGKHPSIHNQALPPVTQRAFVLLLA
ncbi:hypothetical protein Fcan01_14158 [Folsomia candida]|uniref:Uncharacterized protein n=1 Tax=Folsomia candida TaxID=158441 RepID=A0A226E019_FOLCA|nr:hypothetical protein Fcan01_14158 [Folsomia candida]